MHIHRYTLACVTLWYISESEIEMKLNGQHCVTKSQNLKNMTWNSGCGTTGDLRSKLNFVQGSKAFVYVSVIVAMYDLSLAI